MTTWTYDTKNINGLSEADLLIGSAYKLLIGGGFFLIIQPSSGSAFAYDTKNTATWTYTNES